MAVEINTKPFLVTFGGRGFGYWLLDPPDDRSPLVKTYFDSLKPRSLADDVPLLANTFELTAIVDEAICATQYYQQVQQIAIGSQCNRMMKHIQVSAIYLSHYEALGNAIVKNIHLAMRRLYERQPPDIAGGMEMLHSISKVTCAVVETAQSRLYHLKKSQDVMTAELSEIMKKQATLQEKNQLFARNYMQSMYGAEVDIATTQESGQSGTHYSEETMAIKKFLEAITKSSDFWQHLLGHLKNLEQSAKEISCTSVEDATQSISQFEHYKRLVIQISAGWIAIRRICTILLKELSPQLIKVVDLAVPNNVNNWDDFNEFARIINVHFNDLDSLLMSTDFKIQNEVGVYSTWVKPTMNASFPMCLETVDQVTCLVKAGKIREVSRKLMEVSQLSGRIKTITEVYIERLEELEKYAIYQQEKLMKKMSKLEENRNRKRQDIQNREVYLASKQRQVHEYEELKWKAEVNKYEAESKKRDAEARQEEVARWWWVPVVGLVLCIRELIEDNSSKIAAENRRIEKYETDCSNLEDKIHSLRMEISNLRSDVSWLSSQINNLKDELTKKISMLKEMREATATLKESVFHWKEFTVMMEHGEERSGAMQKIVTKASKLKDPARVLRSRGTESTMKSFTEAFEKAESILRNQWQYMVTYEYVCVLCGNDKSGLPLPVDRDTVVCNECAHRYVE